MLRVRLFGTIRVEERGRVLATNLSANTLQLLAYLLLHRMSSLPRSSVAFTLWPDDSEADALVRLRRYLFRLNAALPKATPEPWIVGDKWTIQWNPAAPLWLDVAEFQALSEDPATADEALALYDGGLLAAYEGEWLEPIRENARNRFAATLLEQCALKQKQGDPRAALAYAQRLNACDPWREDVVRTMMLLRLELGDRAGAIATFRHFTERLSAELQATPMIETRELFESVAAEPQERPNHNLPAAVNDFVGRRGELETLHAMVRSSKHRVITLVGFGGVGKSRLGLEVARSLWHERAGTWLVELARVAASDEVPMAIASALGAREACEGPLLDPVCGLIGAQDVLIILDNCEHVLDGAASAAAAIVKACPRACVMATSREILHIEAETRFYVLPLPVPLQEDGPVPALSYPSIELFLSRASKHGRPLRLNEENVRLLFQIAQRLDGIPLAIELAASRLNAVSLAELARGLTDRFRMLVGGSRDGLPQHRTMKALIEWSFQFLSDDERNLLNYLAVFSGGMIQEASGALFSDRGSGESDAFIAIGGLIDKSLVIATGEETTRYSVLEPIADYSFEELEKTGELKAMRYRHARWFCDVAERAWAARGSGLETDWLAPLRVELNNFRSALTFCLKEGEDVELGARTASSLVYMFRHVMPYEGLSWLELALQSLPQSPPPRILADVYYAIGTFAGIIQTHPDWIEVNRRAAELYRTMDVPERLADTLHHLVTSYGAVDQFQSAYETAQEFVAVSREIGVPRRLFDALCALAVAAGVSGHDAVRHEALAEALRAYRSPQPERELGEVHEINGYVERYRGNTEVAINHYREAFKISQLTPELRRFRQVLMLRSIAVLAFLAGDAESSSNASLEARRLAEKEEQVIRTFAIDSAAYAHGAKGDFVTAVRLLGFVDGQKNGPNARIDDEHARLLEHLHRNLEMGHFEQLHAEGLQLSAEAASALAGDLGSGGMLGAPKRSF